MPRSLRTRRSASYVGLTSANPRASYAARCASKKSGTRCELLLARHIAKVNIRFSTNPKGLPGKPDIVCIESRLAVFCDGDFWHGRLLKHRLSQLKKGHNPH